MKQKHTVKFSQAMKADEEEIRGVHDVRPKSKQLSIAGALLSFTLYDRKHKEGGNY